jgi:hypothetical protein
LAAAESASISFAGIQKTNAHVTSAKQSLYYSPILMHVKKWINANYQQNLLILTMVDVKSDWLNMQKASTYIFLHYCVSNSKCSYE